MDLLTIFFIWLGSSVPEPYQEKFQECLDNYGNCRLIGEKEQTELVKKYDMFNPNNTIIQRADVLRLLVMQQYGGIYMDFDVQINDWNYLKILRCTEDTFFSEEQIALLYERIYRVGNWMACSGKNTSELTRLIAGIPRNHPKPTNPQQVLDYAGPGFLQKMKAKYMIVYPNIKHCYQNNWTVKREGCQTPFYHPLDYLGIECFYVLGASLLLVFLALFIVRKKFFPSASVSDSAGGAKIAQRNHQLQHLNAEQDSV